MAKSWSITCFRLFHDFWDTVYKFYFRTGQIRLRYLSQCLGKIVSCICISTAFLFCVACRPFFIWILEIQIPEHSVNHGLVKPHLCSSQLSKTRNKFKICICGERASFNMHAANRFYQQHWNMYVLWNKKRTYMIYKYRVAVPCRSGHNVSYLIVHLACNLAHCLYR